MAKKKKSLNFISYDEYNNKKSFVTADEYQKNKQYNTYMESLQRKKEKQNLMEQRKQVAEAKHQAATKFWQDTTRDMTYSDQGDQSWMAYAAKMINDTPGALEREQQKEADRQERERAAATKFWRETNAYYNSPAGNQPGNAYAAKMINDTPGAYQREMERLTKLYEEQLKNARDAENKLQSGYQGYEYTKDAITNNGQNRYGVQPYSQVNNELWQDIISGKYNEGTDPRRMNREGLTAFIEQNQNDRRVAENEIKKINEGRAAYQKWGDVFDLLEGIEEEKKYNASRDMNLMPNERGAANMEYMQLTGSADERREAALQQARDYLDNGFNPDLFTDEDVEAQRMIVYSEITGSKYSDAVKNMTADQKAELDKRIDAFISAKRNERDNQDPETEATLDNYRKMISVYDANEKRAKDLMAQWNDVEKRIGWANETEFSGEYDPSLINAEYEMTDQGDTSIFRNPLLNLGAMMVGNGPKFEIKGSELDKAYYYMNNLPETGTLENQPGQVSKYYFATPEMVEAYNKLYKQYLAYGDNQAEMFLKGIDQYLTYCTSLYNEYYYRNKADKPEIAIPERLLTYPMNVSGGMKATAGTVMSLLGDEEAQDPNSKYYLDTKRVQTVREQQNKKADEWMADNVWEGFRGKTEFLLNVADSITDNLIAMGIGGTVTGDVRSKAGMRIVQAVMSSEATGHTMLNKLEQGYDPTEAALYSIADGTIEWITERVSLETILKPDVRSLKGKELIKYLTKAGIAEGSEEINADLLNWGIDSIMSMINDHATEIEQRYQQLVNSGMDPTEAEKQVLKEKVEQIGLSGLAGMLSGIGMSAGHTVGARLSIADTGRNIKSQATGTQDLISAAKNMGQEAESYRLAEELENKTKKNKNVSNFEVGNLALNLMQDTNESIANNARTILEGRIETELKNRNYEGEDAQEMAQLITKALEADGIDNLSKAERQQINSDKAALNTYMDFRHNEETMVNVLDEQMEKTQDMRGIRSTVTGMLENRTQAYKPGDIHMATVEEVEQAEQDAEDNGRQRTRGAREAVYDGKFAQVDGITRTQDNITKEWHTTVRMTTADGQQVNVEANEVRSTNLQTAMIIRDAAAAPEMYSQEFTDILLRAAENNRIDEKKIANALSEAQMVRLFAYTGANVNTLLLDNIDRDTAREIYLQGVEEHRKNRETQTKNATRIENGRITYNGAEYGTSEWNNLIKELDPSIRDQMDAIAGIAQRAGVRVDFVDGADVDDKTYGWINTKGEIGVNINGVNYSTLTNQPSGRHNMIVTLGHELTHWLMQNSLQGYNRLEQYVLGEYMKKYGAKGLMDRLGQYMYTTKDVGLSLEDAIAEVVANASDQVLFDENTIKHIQQNDGKLFTQIKNFVSDLVSRIKNALKGEESASKEARVFLRNMNELSKLWTGAYDEALNRTVTQAEEATAAEISNMSRAQIDEGYMDAVEANNEELMRQYLDESAKRAGFDTNLWYHGSRLFGFTEFNMGRMNNAIFLTNDSRIANKYGYYYQQTENGVRNISDATVNIDKLSEMDDAELIRLGKLYMNDGRGVVRDIRVNNRGQFVVQNYFDYIDETTETTHDRNRYIYQLENAIRRQEGETETQGVYQFYTRPGNQYEVDAQQSEYNEITITGQQINDDTGRTRFDTQRIASWARQHGYDSVLIRNIKVSDGQYSDYMVMFNQADVKSADLITYDDNGEIIKPSERFNDEQTDIRFSKHIYNGEDYILVDTPAFNGRTDVTQKEIQDYLKDNIGDRYTIIESGQKVMVTKQTTKEYARSGETSRLMRNDPDAYSSKANAASQIREIIENLERKNRKHEYGKHKNVKRAKYGLYKYNTTFAIKINDNYLAYDADVLILNYENGNKELYDVIINKENTDLEQHLLVKARHSRSVSSNRIIAEDSDNSNIKTTKALEQDLQESDGTETHYGDHELFSRAVTDRNELDFLNNQRTIKTYKTMQLIDGKLYPPMAAVVAGSMEDASVLGQWEKATEHPELIKAGNKFTLNKGKGKGSLAAAYNPYMHSSNLMINDQFTGAYDRPNLVTVECEVPVSELDSGYHAEYAKDSVGWHSWHTGPVAGQIRKAKGIERQVMLSRWIKPTRIVPNSEVAAHYAELLNGTDIAVPDNVVPPQLLTELKKQGVKVQESGRVNNELKYSKAQLDSDYMDAVENDDMEAAQRMVDEVANDAFNNSKVRNKDGELLRMYHGTSKEFNEFKREYIGSTGRFEGSGFNFTPYEGRASSYGKNVLTGYLNIQNPLSSEKKTISVLKLAQIIRETDPTGDNIIANYAKDTRDYGSDSFVRRESMTTARQIWNWSENDVDIYSEISSADPDAESLISKFESIGYDGLIHYDENGNIKTAVAFNSNQFKRADPITYDDNGKVIPLSERFNKSSNDIRYSRWTEEGMDVNYWMEHATPGMVQTEDERALIQAYRGKRISMALSLRKQSEYRAKIRTLQELKNLSVEQIRELNTLEEKLETEKKKTYQLEEELIRITQRDGWAGAMYQHNMVFTDYIEGKTQDEVKKTVDEMVRKVKEAQEQIQKDTENLKKLAETQAVRTMKSQLGKTSLEKLATQLKSYYNTSMSKSEISDRMAEMALKLASGQDITADAETLAREMLERMRGERSETLSSLKGTTLVIGQNIMNQLKAEHTTLAEMRRRIKGSGVTIKQEQNSRLDSQWAELRENNQALPDISDKADADKLHAIVDFIESELRAGTGSQQYDVDIDEATLFVKSMASNVSTYLTDNPAARRQIESLMKQIAELNQQHEKTVADMDALNDKLNKAMEAGLKAKGLTDVMDRDVKEAIQYFNTTARVAAENERNKVRKNLIKQLRSETAQKLLKQQEEFREQLKNDKKTRELVQDNEAERRKIHTVASRMANRLFAETDKKNIPEEAKALVREIINILYENDSYARRVSFWDNKQLTDIGQRLMRMKSQYGEFNPESDLDWLVIKAPNAADNDYSLRNAVWQNIENIEKGIFEYRNAEGRAAASLQDRNNALNKIQEAISEIWNVIKARNEAFIRGQAYEINDLAQRMVNEMNASKFKGDWVGKGSSAVNAMERAVGYGNLTPEYFFKNLRNSVMTLLHSAFHEAENEAGLQALKAKAVIEGIAKETGFNTWDPQEKHQVILGQYELTMTTEQLMALYATWIREKNQMRPEITAHLLNGGFVLAQENKNDGLLKRERSDQHPIRLKEDMLDSIGSYLTDKQRDYVHEVVSYMSNELAELGNETSMREYGIRKFTEPFYFPIKSWGGVLNSRSDAGITNKNDNRAMRQSFTKNLTANAQNAIEIADFTATAMKHIVGMITFNTVGPAVENMNKVLNRQLIYGDIVYDNEGEVQEDNTFRRNVRASFKNTYGTNALRYLEKFMEDVNGGMTRQTEKSLQERMLSVFRKGAVAGSLSVAAQQPMSYIRAAVMINPKYLAAALSPTHWGKIHEEMLKYSGVAVIKDMGRFDMNQGQSMIDFITPEEKISKARKAGRTAAEMTTILPEKMDALTWGRMWIACKLETAAQHKGMDQKSDEFMRLVAERFNEVMRMTQVYDSMLVKSQNMRSTNYAIKAMTSFMAEPTLSLNVLANAVRNFNTKGGKVKMAKALVTFVMSAAAQAAVKAAMSSGRSPDKKKKWEEQFLTKWFNMFMSEVDPLTLVPGYSDIVELLKNGELADDAWSVIGKIKTMAETTIKAFNGKGKGWYRDIEDTVGQAAQLFTRVPMKNLMRDLRAVYNFINPDTYAKRPFDSSVVKYGIQEGFYTADNMIGVVNEFLKTGGAGFGTANADWYARIYEAEKAGNKQEAQNIRDYLEQGKGTKAKSIDDALKKMVKEDESLSYSDRIKNLKTKGVKDTDIAEWIVKEYNEGKIKRSDAEKLWREADPTKDANDAYFKFEQQDYESKTGSNVTDTKWFKLNDAINKGTAADYNAAVKELTAHGETQKDIDDHAKSQVTKAYKEGKLTSKQATEKLKQYRKDMTEDDIWWTLDRIDYNKATGKDAGSGQYYRLYDAIDSNKSDKIKDVVDIMLKHGMKKENIKKQLSSNYKQAYLAATGNDKIRMRDALTKAYKAIGISATEAQKIIDGWKKTK